MAIPPKPAYLIFAKWNGNIYLGCCLERSLGRIHALHFLGLFKASLLQVFMNFC